MQIPITSIHIEAGVRESQICCPIALAMWDALERADYSPHSVRVLDRSALIEFRGSARRHAFRFPVIATIFTRNYDALGRAAVTPFTLDLPIEKFISRSGQPLNRRYSQLNATR